MYLKNIFSQKSYTICGTLGTERINDQRHEERITIEASEYLYTPSTEASGSDTAPRISRAHKRHQSHRRDEERRRIKFRGEGRPSEGFLTACGRTAAFVPKISRRNRGVRFLLRGQGKTVNVSLPPRPSRAFRRLFPRARTRRVGLKTTTPPAHRTFSCESRSQDWSQDEPATVCYAGIVDFPPFFSSSRQHAALFSIAPAVFFRERNDGGAVARRRSFPSHKSRGAR